MTTLAVLAGYKALDEHSLRDWLAGAPLVAARLGGDKAGWQVKEVGDGNLNLVFLVTGPLGGVCVKQALPYVRVVGESWPVSLTRAYYEHQHAVIAGPFLPGLIPAPLHYDEQQFASVVELLTPHTVLRYELIAGKRYPQMAAAVAEFVARSAVHTSPLAQRLETVADTVAAVAHNLDLTRITAELVFADPYETHPRNSWTTPYLDDVVANVQSPEVVAAAAEWGHRFLTRKEALLHGDLHTGSVMVSDNDTRVIDAEFTLYGPVGFDVGMFIANLLMAYFTQPAHAAEPGERDAFGEWLLGQVTVFWGHFAQCYDELWAAHATGDAWPERLFSGESKQAAFAAGRARRLADIYQDALGFAAIEIIRRIIGFSHNRDFTSITDPVLRASCERPALLLARELLLSPSSFAEWGLVLQRARTLASQTLVGEPA